MRKTTQFPSTQKYYSLLTVFHHGEILLLGISSGLEREKAKQGFWTCSLRASGNLTHAINGKMPGLWTFPGYLEALVWERSHLPFPHHIKLFSSSSYIQGYIPWNTYQIHQLAASSLYAEGREKPIGVPYSSTQYLPKVNRETSSQKERQHS